MFGLFNKESEKVVAPVAGKCIAIEKVPDRVFSEKLLGDGFAIIPTQNVICSPIDGTVTMIATTKHAFGVRNNKGMEVLVHIGLDTVALHGEGFEVLVPQGKTVKKGKPIIAFDDTIMKKNDRDMTTMVIFTGGYDTAISIACDEKEVKMGDVIL